MSKALTLLAALLVLAPSATLAQSAYGTAPGATPQPAPLNVEIDRATRVQLSAAAGSVIVGNPNIADVTVVDARTLFITGKGYGVTEVVAVDAIGRTVFQRQVVVTAGATGAVRVWRGAEATELACAASCAPSVRSAGTP